MSEREREREREREKEKRERENRLRLRVKAREERARLDKAQKRLQNISSRNLESVGSSYDILNLKCSPPSIEY